uniref:Uncharacterized protein n=1 Tax=Alexandrium catenella TaxID=2925 RepID=A0A7S1RJI3_ALECA|mmetsp:Transcript_59463/g.159248  ORF Transcript_59463/g.159248 Transcript_59463/m.159248 type:complete len:239 (+) Transcript_59463:95-811(+)
MLGLLGLSLILADEPCQGALDNGKINPVSKLSGDVWMVDPFIRPPKGSCQQMPVDGAGNYLNMDFDAYPNITAQCDHKIKFVMRTVSRQQRHGVYLTEFSGGVTADSWPPCPAPVFNGAKFCDVRLNESDQKDTQCEGYTQLYPLLMFGPSDTIIKEYTTPTLRTMVAAGSDTDTLVFSCPWIQGRRSTSGTYTSHCINGMFVHVTVQGCGTTSSALSADANSAWLLVVLAAAINNFG